MRLNHILLGPKQGVTVKQCICFSCVVCFLGSERSKKYLELKEVSICDTHLLGYICHKASFMTL